MSGASRQCGYSGRGCRSYGKVRFCLRRGIRETYRLQFLEYIESSRGSELNRNTPIYTKYYISPAMVFKVVLTEVCPDQPFPPPEHVISQVFRTKRSIQNVHWPQADCCAITVLKAASSKKIESFILRNDNLCRWLWMVLDVLSGSTHCNQRGNLNLCPSKLFSRSIVLYLFGLARSNPKDSEAVRPPSIVLTSGGGSPRRPRLTHLDNENTRPIADWKNTLGLGEVDGAKLEVVSNFSKRISHVSWRYLSATAGPEHRRLLVRTVASACCRQDPRT